MATGVPDEVWQRLDPRAGKLSRRTTIRMWLASAGAVVVLVAGTLAWRTGIVVPRLVWPDGPTAWEHSDDGVIAIEFVVSNAGRFPVAVLDVGRDGPGLDLLRVESGFGDSREPAVRPFPVTLQSGEGRVVTLVYRITDCDAAPRGAWPVTARVGRPWGTMTVDVPADPEGYRSWPSLVVDSWCHW